MLCCCCCWNWSDNFILFPIVVKLPATNYLILKRDQRWEFQDKEYKHLFKYFRNWIVLCLYVLYLPEQWRLTVIGQAMKRRSKTPWTPVWWLWIWGTEIIGLQLRQKAVVTNTLTSTVPVIIHISSRLHLTTVILCSQQSQPLSPHKLYE